MFKCIKCGNVCKVKSVRVYELDCKTYKGSICRDCAYEQVEWIKK